MCKKKCYIDVFCHHYRLSCVFFSLFAGLFCQTFCHLKVLFSLSFGLSFQFENLFFCHLSKANMNDKIIDKTRFTSLVFWWSSANACLCCIPEEFKQKKTLFPDDYFLNATLLFKIDLVPNCVTAITVLKILFKKKLLHLWMECEK